MSLQQFSSEAAAIAGYVPVFCLHFSACSMATARATSYISAQCLQLLSSGSSATGDAVPEYFAPVSLTRVVQRSLDSTEVASTHCDPVFY